MSKPTLEIIELIGLFETLRQVTKDELTIYLNEEDYIHTYLNEIDVTLFKEMLQKKPEETSDYVETKKRRQALSELNGNVMELRPLKKRKLNNQEQFKCKIDKPLSEQIWQSIENQSKRNYVLMRKLSRLQHQEFERINTFMDINLKNLGYYTKQIQFTKTTNGYMIKRLCRAKNCKSVWIMNINSKTSDALIECEAKCLHTI